MTRPAFRSVALSLLMLALTAACHRSPTTPSEQRPVSSRLEIIAPRTLAPGATAQIRVMVQWSDGRTEDVTARAIFRSLSPDVLAISPDGTITALKPGESSLSAQSSPFLTVKEIVVVPDNTFRVRGRITEADTQVRISEARVEADGVSPVLTDSFGLYVIYGLRGNSRLRVTRPGYVTSEVTLAISDHHTENIALELAAPRLQVGGAYQMTVEAPSSCRDQLPEAILTRRYAVEITQDGAAIRGTLSGANFARGSNVVVGQVEPTRWILKFNDEPFDSVVNMVEIIDERTYLVLSGAASLVAADTGFAGSFSGSFLIFSGAPLGYEPYMRCGGSSRVTLTR